uniref:DUF5131 family protein n=1 Tax=viral metagenome TaxID=1070528 RepID=A0A6M3X772_9ZZZZ
MNKQGEHGIEWTDYTLNQITGCLNHVNGLCKGGGFRCYAYTIANRFKERYLANENVIPNPESDVGLSSDKFAKHVWANLTDPFYPRIWPERFKPLKGYPEGTKIFLDDMSDWMGSWIPDEWKIRTLDFIKAHPQYIVQTLTKQPQELWVWSPFPENCWVGVTATNQNMYENAMLYLGQIEAKVKFMSFEPLLQPIDISFKLSQWITRDIEPRLDWLIIGQQTPVKAATTPKIEHIQEIVEAADKAGVKVFLKENLSPILSPNSMPWAFKYSCSGKPSENFVDYELRQEFPKC